VRHTSALLQRDRGRLLVAGIGGLVSVGREWQPLDIMRARLNNTADGLQVRESSISQRAANFQAVN
jgi:hypothetical protein